jgi:hypothetical protein
LAPAKRSLSLGRQIEGGDNKCAVTNFIWHVNHLKIPSRSRLTEPYPRTITAGELFSCPTQDLPDFLFSDVMIENVRQAGFWINPEAQFHLVSLYAISVYLASNSSTSQERGQEDQGEEKANLMTPLIPSVGVGARC